MSTDSVKTASSIGRPDRRDAALEEQEDDAAGDAGRDRAERRRDGGAAAHGEALHAADEAGADADDGPADQSSQGGPQVPRVGDRAR